MERHDFEFIAICLISGVGLLLTAIRRQKRLKVSQDTPTSKIASAPQGFVELQGFAWPRGAETVTNLKGEPMVYYSLLIERQESRGSGKSRRTLWVPVFSMSHKKSFYLLDGTGLAEIHSREADLELGRQDVRAWNKLSSEEKLECGIRARGISGFPPASGILGLFSSAFRVTEVGVGVGSPVLVSGDFRSDTGEKILIQDAALSSFARKVINFSSRSLKDVRGRLDRNGDGKISESEARLGYAEAASVALRSPDKEPISLQFHGKVEGSEDHKIFISDMHEDHLHEKLGRFLWLRLAGGSVLTALGVILALRVFIPDGALNNWASHVFRRSPAAMADGGPACSRSGTTPGAPCASADRRSD